MLCELAALVVAINADVTADTRVINSSWEELKTISTQIASNNKTESELVTSAGTDTYGLKIGDKKVDNGLTYYIAGFNHDVANGETGITIVFRDKTDYKMNPTGTNNGGYDGSDIHKNYINTISLPVVAKTVTKTIDQGTYSSGSPIKNGFITKISSETRWLLSYQEAGFGATTADALDGEGTAYPMFLSDASRKVFCDNKPAGASSLYWRLRSVGTNGGSSFWYVMNGGFSSKSYGADDTFGVVLAFNI